MELQVLSIEIEYMYEDIVREHIDGRTTCAAHVSNRHGYKIKDIRRHSSSSEIFLSTGFTLSGPSTRASNFEVPGVPSPVKALISEGVVRRVGRGFLGWLCGA